jgi:protein required for attachment to host cells
MDLRVATTTGFEQPAKYIFASNPRRCQELFFLQMAHREDALNEHCEDKAMSMIKVPWESWVVVCDGAKALILQNAGDAELMNLQVHETLTQPNEPDREIGAGKPGRSHAADGQSRSAVEEVDFHDQAEDQFLKEVAGKLDELVHQKNAKRIVLVAPPKALGSIRPNLSSDVQAAITAEVAKDLTNFPVDQIERHLAA